MMPELGYVGWYLQRGVKVTGSVVQGAGGAVCVERMDTGNTQVSIKPLAM